MDYQRLCLQIFGTDDPEQLAQIAAKADKYDTLFSTPPIMNVRGAGRRPKIDSQTAERLYEMYQEGCSVVELAKTFHITRPTVYRYVEMLRQQKENSCIRLHMDFMYEDQVCTVIEVDFFHEKIHIENKTNRTVLTAFGVNRHPTWEDFQSFLESRCLPRTRCQARRILADAGIDSYDPLQIIEQTQGRMAEDHHWIRLQKYA